MELEEVDELESELQGTEEHDILQDVHLVSARAVTPAPWDSGQQSAACFISTAATLGSVPEGETNTRSPKRSQGKHSSSRQLPG